MIVLLHEPDYGRIRERLSAACPQVRPLIASPEGRLVFGGSDVARGEIAPDIVWITRSVFDDGKADLFLEAMIAGPAVRWVQTFNAGLDTSFRKMLAYGMGFSEDTLAMADAIGLDTSVFKAAIQRGRRLCNSNAMAVPIAEYVISQIAAVWYPIEAQRAAQHANEWTHTPFRELSGSRWLIVGYGNNGREIARRAKAFGAHVTGVRRTPAPDAFADDVVTMLQGLASIGEADIVVLCCPLSAATENLFDAEVFSRMRPGSILVNIGRGGLIDDSALAAALDNDAPRVAILDAFRQEPLPAASPLWSHPKIRITAHCSWAGDGVVARNDALFLDNLGRFLNGAPLINEVAAEDV